MNIEDYKQDTKKSVKVSNPKIPAPSIKWGNLFDYLTWRGDLTFDKSPYNVIDGLLFTVLAYLNLPKRANDKETTLSQSIRLLNKKPIVKRYSGIFVMRDNAISLVKEVAKSARFKDIKISDISIIKRKSIEQQFGAMTFTLPDNSYFVAYRGTDDSLTGWKEDFNMAFMSETPSQVEACNYLFNIMQKYDGKIRVGGHSKGGNLAVWAATNIPNELKPRIDYVYNFDGPGFLPEFFESNNYQNIKDKILTFIPASSIVGVLMGSKEYLTIKSDNLSVLQHDPFSWHIAGKRFDYVINRSKTGKKLEQSVNQFIQEMTKEEREEYVEHIYEVLSDAKVNSLKDLETHKLRHIFSTVPKVIKETYMIRTNSKKN